MSSLSEIRAAVSEQERINTQLRQELYELQSGIASADNKWNQLANYINGTLAEGAKRIVNSHELTVRSYELQCEIEEMYKLFKNIELANKKIRACKNKSYYEFKNYRAVRKIVQAMLNNIEVSYVSDATIMKAIEVQHLQLPDYWLTCALLSIMAWRNDDKELADRALARAYKLDKKNTSMFFFAFHIRIGKDAVALKWFNSYISCARTGEDEQNIMLMFSIVNKTLLENCDATLVSNISAFVDKLIKEDLSRSGYSEDEIVEKIRGYLGAYRANDALDYPLLANYCKEWSFLKSEMMSAKTNERVLDFVLKTAHITDSQEKKDFLNAYIDDLIAKTNDAEKDVANEIKYNELVIAKGGHIEEAKEEYDRWLTHKETEFTIVSEMIDWIYGQDVDGMNPMIRLMMFRLTKKLNREAISRNVFDYRARFRSDLDIKIDVYESHANLSNTAGENGKIEEFFRKMADEQIAMQKMWPAYVWFGVGGLCTAGAIALSSPALFVGTAVGIVGGVLKILLTGKNKKRIAQDCQAKATSTKETFALLSTEFSKYANEYAEYDAYFDRIESEFEKL